MNEDVEKFFTAKAKQRKLNAPKSVAEKLRTLDRLKERNEQIKRARRVANTGDVASERRRD